MQSSFARLERREANLKHLNLSDPDDGTHILQIFCYVASILSSCYAASTKDVTVLSWNIIISVNFILSLLSILLFL